MIERYFERMLEKRDEGGFTLIELLIVIIILAILAAIVVFAVGSTGANSKFAACNSDAKTYETALESYKAQLGTYPVSLSTSALTTPATTTGYSVAPGASLTQTVTNGTSTAGPALRSLPGTSHYQIVSDGNGVVYVLPPAPFAVPTYLFPGETAAQAGVTGDAGPINFDTNSGAVCSDASIVK
ncbi:MAG TPA: prepilin-type N-terminal cleavage/methylation domain-containing protein [Acidimicrobiales bacterium]|nr:prepilin-type N-terminal cleavage/methylation domain-containing protein [Acidimicrobiales bacterium]